MDTIRRDGYEVAIWRDEWFLCDGKKEILLREVKTWTITASFVEDFVGAKTKLYIEAYILDLFECLIFEFCTIFT